MVGSRLLIWCGILAVAQCCFFILDPWGDAKSTHTRTLSGYWRILLYGMIFGVYVFGKWALKRTARSIDRAIIIANFSYEIITEILISSFYWINFRMFLLRFEMGIFKFEDEESYISFGCIAFIHLSHELFQNYIRFTAPYFNCRLTYCCRTKKKSNITQWKVRGAIDTSVRFIISIYSWIFIVISYSSEIFTFAFVKDVKHLRYPEKHTIPNSLIFIVEMLIFLFIIFKPGCAGKISDQQQINMAEPLMRMYNAHHYLFPFLFCASLIMTSLLIV